eukprot:UN30390
MKNINNARTKCENSPNGYECDVKCKHDYEPTGKAVCENGTWTKPVCDEIRCSVFDFGSYPGVIPGGKKSVQQRCRIKEAYYLWFEM